MSSTGSQSGGSRRSTRSTRSATNHVDTPRPASSSQKRPPSSPPSSPPSTRSRRSEQSQPAARSSPRSNRSEQSQAPARSSPRSSRSNQGSTRLEVADSSQGNQLQVGSSQSDGFRPSSSARSRTPLRGNVGLLSDPINLSSPLRYGSTDHRSGLSQGLSQSSTRSTASRQRRQDIAREAKVVRQINLGENEAVEEIPEATSEPTSQSSSAPQFVIWGTDVAINLCKDKFKRFLRFPGFEAEQMDIDEQQMSDNLTSVDEIRLQREQPYYIRKLQETVLIGEAYLNVNCLHVQRFDANLYRQLVCYPQEVIPTFDMALNEVFTELYPDGVQDLERVFVRPYNAAKTSNLRNLNPEDINQLVTISGMVIRCSNIIAEMREAFFECSVCNWSTTVEVDRGSIAEPSVCKHCNTNFSFRLVHNRSMFTDKQQIKLQESPDDMPPGQTPYTVLLYACDDLVDRVHPGERVTITGIYRATSVRVHPRQRNVKSVYRTHIDVVHFRKVETKRLHDEESELKLSKERVDKLIALSKLDDIYERLANALAPSIYEHEDIKKGILLQLFGGTRKEYHLANNPTGKLRSFRSEINILLCGDPGTSKSQLLQYVYNLVPRGQYTSGKGSSAVGLTAYVTKDPDTKQMVLQTGALVLCDGGICCIDEFDKMSDSTRSVLHEVMEQQTLSIAKAGIVCQLNARTSILAAANPVESQWNKNKTIIENIQLPPTLMSRFDLIFLLLDPQDENYDRKLGRHLVSLYHRSGEEEKYEHIELGLLKDYIAYARTNFYPVLSEEAGQALKHAYVEMRKAGSGRGQISAYPRQLESLIRLAEAHAKMHFKNVVEMVDVQEARRLHREAIKQSATDPLSGKIDISILTTGVSETLRKKRGEISVGLKQMLESMKEDKAGQEQIQFSYHQVYKDFKESSTIMVTRDMFDDALRNLQEEGFLNLLGSKWIRLTGST